MSFQHVSEVSFQRVQSQQELEKMFLKDTPDGNKSYKSSFVAAVSDVRKLQKGTGRFRSWKVTKWKCKSSQIKLAWSKYKSKRAKKPNSKFPAVRSEQESKQELTYAFLRKEKEWKLCLEQYKRAMAASDDILTKTTHQNWELADSLVLAGVPHLDWIVQKLLSKCLVFSWNFKFPPTFQTTYFITLLISVSHVKLQ